MTKVISPSGWDWDRPVVMQVKVGSAGLVGHDRRQFLKTASHAFLSMIDNLEKESRDLEWIHLISHGATEVYGPNRNGDGFKKKACRQRAHTFEKFAHWHRNHKNKVADGDPFYGVVKKAYYDENMHRLELLCGLFKNAAAAEKAGGLVADKELEKLAKGSDIPVSMACSVPYDECSWCGNKARTRKDYCTTETCKAGGCKDNLASLVKVGSDVHQLHVDNSLPTWFDISGVYSPADRIAYGARANYITKAASDKFNGGYPGGSAKLAEDLGVFTPLAVMLDGDGRGGPVAEVVTLADGVGRFEKLAGEVGEGVRSAFSPGVQAPVDYAAVGEPWTAKYAESLAAMADRKVILPMREFAAIHKKAELAVQASARLPGVYGRMVGDGTIGERVARASLPPATKAASLAARRLAESVAESHSLDKEAVEYRCRLSSVRNLPNPKTSIGIEKSAADSEAAESLARDYAAYKAAALHRMAAFDDEFPLTVQLAVAQNQVI